MNRAVGGTIALALLVVASTQGHAARPTSGTTEMEGLSIGGRTSGQEQPGYILELQTIHTHQFLCNRSDQNGYLLQVQGIFADDFEGCKAKYIDPLFWPIYILAEGIFLAASYSFTGYTLNGEFLPFLITKPLFDTQDFSLLRNTKSTLTPYLTNKYTGTAESVFLADYGYLLSPYDSKVFAFSLSAGRRVRQIEVDTDPKVAGKESAYDQRSVFKTWVGLVGFRTMPIKHVHLSFDYVVASSPVERRTTLTDPNDVRFVRRLDPFPQRWFASLTFDWY